MILVFLLATIIFLFLLWLGSLLINFVLIYLENKIRYSMRSQSKKSSLFGAIVFLLSLLSIYFCCFLVTVLSKYFFEYQNNGKVFIGCAIPIILGISMISSTRKYARQVSVRESRFLNDTGRVNDKYSFEIQKLKDNFFGVGISASLVLFFVYLILPSFFISSLKFFFLK